MRSMSISMLLFAAAGFALASSAIAEDAPAGQVTFAKDVAPILLKNCGVCHRPGQIGPMALLGYQDARPWAKAIKKAVNEGTMPPWFSSQQHGTFGNDPRLTDAEKAILSKWADTGAPLGDAQEAPPIPEYTKSEWQIGTPDAVFTMEPFTVTDDMEDHYQYMTLKNHLNEDKWIKAAEIRPTFHAGTHHNLTFLGPKDSALGADANKPVRRQRNGERDLFIGWAPGALPMTFEDGFGKLLPANCSITFQMHYHKNPGPGTGGVDQTSLAVKFADKPVEHPVTTAWILDPTLNIPANTNGYKSESVFRFVDDGRIFSMTPHMHVRGQSMTYIAEYPDGKTETLLEVPKWDFNWQLAYKFPEPKSIPRGTKVRVVATYDNTSNNPNNPDPNQNVRWGEETTDEMMIGFMDYVYNEKKSFQRTFALPEGIASEDMFRGGGNGFGGRNRRRGGDAPAPSGGQ